MKTQHELISEVIPNVLKIDTSTDEKNKGYIELH